MTSKVIRTQQRNCTFMMNFITEKSMNNMIYEDESYKLIGICMDIHNNLGSGFLEIVYKDALEYELQQAGIDYAREKMYDVNYKGKTLPHNFFADFVVFDKIILEIKATSSMSNAYAAQAINYLTVSKNRLALIVNFGESSLRYKRIVK